jgi:hypothetical protein
MLTTSLRRRELQRKYKAQHAISLAKQAISLAKQTISLDYSNVYIVHQEFEGIYTLSESCSSSSALGLGRVSLTFAFAGSPL